MSSIYYTRVVLSSHQKISGENNSFIIDLKESYGLQQISHIAVESATVPNLEYNINSRNNRIFFQYGLSPAAPLDFQEGQYDITTLMSELKSKMDTVAGGLFFTITQDPLTRKISIVSSAATVFSFLPSSLGFPSTMYEIIGFVPGTTVISTPITPTVIAARLPDLGGTQTAFIHSQALASGSTVNSTGSISILTSVPFHDVPFGAYGHYQTSDIELSKIRFSQPRNLSVVDIKVRDVDGNLLEISNSEVQVVIRCYYEF
jgi:hypothetical protein